MGVVTYNRMTQKGWEVTWLRKRACGKSATESGFTPISTSPFEETKTKAHYRGKGVRFI